MTTAAKPTTVAHVIRSDEEAIAAARQLAARFAVEASVRDRERRLPAAELDEFTATGLWGITVPKAYGGAGVSYVTVAEVIKIISAADPSLGQIPQNHLGVLDILAQTATEAQKRHYFAKVLEGYRFGNAFSEAKSKNAGTFDTRIRFDGDEAVINGEKFYCTGALFAHIVPVVGLDEAGNAQIAFVERHAQGLTIVDNWDGFGQRTTGSGTSRFVDAVVESGHVIDFATRFKYQTALYQLVLLATLAGIGRSALKDVARQVRERKRIYSHGNAQRVSEDAQVQQVVGEVAALVYAAEASAIRAAQPAQRAYLARFGGDDKVERQANVDAEIESATAQVVVSELIQRATSELFNALGASDVRQGKALDRHWRNARTVSSHNPLIYKARIIGDWAINGTEPPFVWQIGNGPANG